jgi:3-oxoacyl-(acyl-carrier-protein) synthase
VEGALKPWPDVVVTGIAMTTAVAAETESTLKKLLDGQSGIRKLDDPFIEPFDLPVRIGGRLQDETGYASVSRRGITDVAQFTLAKS